YRFTCTDCAACAEPEDCVRCGELLQEMLLRLVCVKGVDVDMNAGWLCIETNRSDEASLTRFLRYAGILVEAASIRPEYARRKELGTHLQRR
ncbi:MAG: hypothetical protein ACI4AL_03585, partial [Aristaeellaceae bacterium]